MAFIDESLVMGGGQPAAPGASATPTRSPFVSETAVTGAPEMPQQSWIEQKWSAAKRAAAPAVNAAIEAFRPTERSPYTFRKEDFLGTAAAAADTVAALPGQIIRAGNAPFVFAHHMLRTNDVRKSAELMKQHLDKMPPWLAAPYETIAKSLGQEQAYRDNPVGWVMGKIGEAAEKVSEKGDKALGIPKELIAETLNAGMAALGATGAVAGARSASRYYRGVEAAKGRQELYRKNDEALARGRAAEADEATAREAQAEAGAELIMTPERFAEIMKQTKQEGRISADEASRSEVDRLIRAGVKPPPETLTPSEAKIWAAEQAVRESQARIAEGQTRAAMRPAEPKSPWDLDWNPDSSAARAKAIELDAQTPLSVRIRQRLEEPPNTAITPSQLKAIAEQAGITRNGKVTGTIDQKLLLALAGGATGAVAAVPLLQAAWNATHPDKQVSFAQFLRGRGIWRPEGEPGQRDRDITPRAPRLRFPDPDISTEPPDSPPYKQYVPPRKGTEVLGDAGLGVAAAGMVFGRKGMPHPELISRLASPLKDTLVSGAEAARFTNEGKVHPADLWADRAVSKWLQKGDMGQGVGEVQVPHGEGTATLKDLFDATLHADPVEKYGFFKNKENIPAGEAVWMQSKPGFAANKAYDSIMNYMSHVGDYLRANVDPAKLSQYDFPRAIRETAANDARVAKEMERAAAKVTMELPTLREYPNGQRWVEIKLPERLTEEQAKGVRPLSQKEAWFASSQATAGKPGYAAIDLNGKPVKNNYTGNVAWGATPETAWLAGRLAEEGNSMGHCVGCYADQVASGETRIFSLRDAKGASHVTVEVEPQRGRAPNAEGVLEPRDGNNILQIKGKLNRAPNIEYLAAVQDLVRNPPDGKAWGEVGNWEHTGLRKVDPDMQEKYKLGPIATIEEVKAAEKRLGSSLMRDETIAAGDELRALIAKNRNAQRGSISPDLFRTMGGVALGAAAGVTLADESPIRGALLGAAAGGVGANLRRGKGTFLEAADRVAGVSSTIIGHIDAALRLLARNYDRLVSTKTEAGYQAAHPFIEAADRLSPEKAAELELAYLNNDAARIRRIDPELAKAYEPLRELLDGYRDKFLQLRRFREGLVDYLPRVVKDMDGLKAALGQEYTKGLEALMLKAEAEMLRTKGRSLTEVEQSILLDNYLKSSPPGSHLPGYAKSRRVKEVTAELAPFYYPLREAIPRYISAAVQDIETAKFFGRDLQVTKQGGKTFTNVDASIGELVSRGLSEGRYTPEQAVELKEVLDARFKGGEQAPHWAIQDFRNLNNITLLGNFGSAATQLGDLMASFYHHGPVAALQALGLKLRGQAISPREYGLINHVMEEMSGGRWSGKALGAVFKLNFFSKIDQFGKESNLTAGWAKNTRLARTAAGREKLAQKWEAAYGDEFPQLVEDLKASRRPSERTDLIDSLLWSELADAQPLSKFEMSPAWNAHPNGRILGQMKTYMQKQADVIRRDVYDELRKGNFATAARNALGFSALLALSSVPGDAIKDWLSGREFKIEDVSLVENLLRNFGINRYSTEKIEKGKPLEVLQEMASPPFKHWQDIGRLDEKSVKYLPPVGRQAYDRFLGGNEEKELRDARNKRKDELDKDPEHRAAVKAREELRRERMKDPAWRQYYLDRARGERPPRPQ